jgi:hypothetical protein
MISVTSLIAPLAPFVGNTAADTPSRNLHKASRTVAANEACASAAVARPRR